MTVLDHPVLSAEITQLRKIETDTHEFRSRLARISFLLAVEATRTLATREISVRTPLAECTGRVLAATPIIAPVLRAGLGLMPGFLELLPGASVAHLGFYRDPETLRPVPYYANLPDRPEDRDVFLLDPMLATGNSAIAAIAFLRKQGVLRITLVALLAAQAGIDAVASSDPDVRIVAAAVDPELNDHGYIVPGLGDAGDRQFGTDRSSPIV